MANIDTRQLDDFDESGWSNGYYWRYNSSTENWEAVAVDPDDGDDDTEQIDFGGSNRYALSNTPQYKIYKDVIYLGAVKTLTAAYVLCDPVGSITVKIYDATNAQTIAEATSSGTDMQILSLGTISNLPSGNAQFEIQAKGSAGGGNIYCLTLQYD